MALPPDPLEAYRNAQYVVFGARRDAPDMVLRVGEPSADLDELLEADFATSAAFVSPGNRRGRRQTQSENAAAFLELNSLLNGTRYRRYPGEGRDPQGKWGAEASVLIVGIARAEAEALGRKLGQNAIVFAEKGRAPELVLLA
jgi:hypothetical protein